MKKILTIIIAVVALQLALVSASYASGNTYHKVHYGETLFSIGRLYNVHPYHIAEANGLHNPNVIYAGQVLYIPSGSTYPWPCGRQDCHDGGWDNCGGNCGWQDSGWRDGCGRNDCGWQRSGWQDGGWDKCGGNDCGWQGGWDKGGWDNCGGNDCGWQKSGWQGGRDKGGWDNCGGNDCGGWNNCGGNNCNSGYDYTGYYYGNQRQRYSHTCGYYSNCW